MLKKSEQFVMDMSEININVCRFDLNGLFPQNLENCTGSLQQRRPLPPCPNGANSSNISVLVTCGLLTHRCPFQSTCELTEKPDNKHSIYLS